MQTIDESAISSLSLAVQFASHINQKTQKPPSDDQSILSHQSSDWKGTRSLPKFLWLLRDFVLELKENGRDITENEYLESRLSNFSKSKNQRNKKVREALHKAFQSRELITMVRPVEDDGKIGILEQQAWMEMREAFRNKVEVLRHKIHKETPPKQINGRAINGQILATLIEKYVSSFNKGLLPDITSAWDNIVQSSIQSSFQNSLNHIDKLLASAKFPLSKLELTLFADSLIETRDTLGRRIQEFVKLARYCLVSQVFIAPKNYIQREKAGASSSLTAEGIGPEDQDFRSPCISILSQIIQRVQRIGTEPFHHCQPRYPGLQNLGLDALRLHLIIQQKTRSEAIEIFTKCEEMIEGHIEWQEYEHKLNEVTEFANKRIFELKRINLSESLQYEQIIQQIYFQKSDQNRLFKLSIYPRSATGQQVQNSFGQDFAQYFNQMKAIQSEQSLLPFIKETFKEKIKRVNKACLDIRKQQERGKKTTEEQYKDLEDRYSEILQEHTLLEKKEKVLDERLELCTDRIEKNKSIIDQRSLMIQRLELERQQIEQNLGDLSEIKAPLSDRSKGNRSARSNNNRSYLYKEGGQKQLTDNSEIKRHRRKDSEDFSELPSMIQEESQAPQQTERMAHLEKLEKGKVSYMLKRMKEAEKEKQKRKKQGRSRNETDSEDEGATKKDPAIKFIKKIIDRKK